MLDMMWKKSESRNTFELWDTGCGNFKNQTQSCNRLQPVHRNPISELSGSWKPILGSFQVLESTTKLWNMSAQLHLSSELESLMQPATSRNRLRNQLQPVAQPVATGCNRLMTTAVSQNLEHFCQRCFLFFISSIRTVLWTCISLVGSLEQIWHP